MVSAYSSEMRAQVLPTNPDMAQAVSWGQNLRTKTQSLGEMMQYAFGRRHKPSDAVLLVGSGRTGTTWLSTLLVARSGLQVIFEPENPNWTEEVRSLTGWQPTFGIRSFYLRRDISSVEWFHFWSEALSGRVRNVFTDQIRTSYFPSAYLVKMIRANLMLGYISDNFRPRIVYCIRHPCAVIASRMALGWKADVMDLLSQRELVEDLLGPWVSLIEKERDPLGAHAVWWAVENMAAMRILATTSAARVSFETLCLRPTDEVARLRSALGMQVSGSLNQAITRPSATSFRVSPYSSTVDRLASWKSQLDHVSQRRILDWANRMGISMYGDATLPITDFPAA
jgi:sulfotransferase family protein